MKKILALTALSAGLFAGSASALTLSYSDTFGLATTNWTNNLTGLNQFNSSLGTLNSATFTINGDIIQKMKAENVGATPDVLTPLAAANMFFRKGSTNLETLLISGTGPSFSATAFDGIDNYAGTSGTIFADVLANNSVSFTLTGSALTDFIGAGNLAAFNIRAQGAGSIDSANGNLSSNITTQARYNLNLVYDYTAAPAQVPEPASMAILGLGFAAMGFAARRKKSA